VTQILEEEHRLLAGPDKLAAQGESFTRGAVDVMGKPYGHAGSTLSDSGGGMCESVTHRTER
jgi:hypothetical protein